MEEAEEKRPPVNVESPVTERVLPSCAVPLAVKVDAVLREPEVKREEETVEEACEKNPPVRVESPVTPSVEESGAAPAIWIVEEEVIGPEELREPPTKREFANVEEADEKRLVREERPLTAREEEAERAPWTWRELLKVEDDWVTRPPRELM